MKYVTANRVTYDASVGRIEAGETYLVEDDKAERWINAGIAAAGQAPKRTEPAAEAQDDSDEQAEDDQEQRAEVKRLFEEGASQRAIAEQLNISRSRVQNLLKD